MEDDKQHDKPTAVAPPPYDPFETYKTPYVRASSAKHQENPFIQFRRFADEQFSSIFNTLGINIPRFFSHNSWPHDEEGGEWAKMYKRRQQMAEGWKKEWEQQIEEMRAETQKLRDKVSEQLPAADVCDDAKPSGSNGSPTELDLYDAHEKVKLDQKKKNQDSAYQENRWEHSRLGEDSQQKHKCFRDKWFTLGYDARRQAPADSAKEPAELRHHSSVVTPYSQDTRTSCLMDPVGNPDQYLPWLLLSPYSPLYLCNPNQDRLVQALFSSAPSGPLYVINPSFQSPQTSDLEQRLALTLPWTDAFEDLLSIHHNGEMMDRNFSTWRTPDDWMCDMVGRGVLKGWEIDDEGKMIRNTDITRKLSEERPERRRDWSKRVFGNKPEGKTPQMDQVESDWPSPMAVAHAIKKATETMQKPADETHVQQEEPTQTSDRAFPSSPSSVLRSSVEAGDQEDGTLISIITTTERIALPDGSVKTKKVLKKRFADGRENIEETMERTRAPTMEPSKEASQQLHSVLPAAMELWSQNKSNEALKASSHDRSTQTTPSVRGEQAQSRGGWFWT